MSEDRVGRRWRLLPVLAAMAALAFAVAFAACGSDDGDSTSADAGDTSTAEETTASDEPVEVAHFVALQANPYETAHIAGVDEAVTAAGGEVTVFDGGNDPQAQTAQCQDAIATQQYDVFLIKAVAGPTMATCVTEALDAGIKVVAVDTPIGEDFNTLEPQVEGLEASVLVLPAEDAAAHVELTAEACGDTDPCEIIYLFGPPEFTFAAEAREVFNQTIKDDYPNIEIVDEASHNFDPDKGYNLTKQLLQAHPDVKVIVSDADPASFGIQRALDELGATDVIHIGGGGSKEGVGFVKDGVWYGTTALVPHSMGVRAAEIGLALAAGEDPGETQINVIQDLSSVGGAITQENVGEFKPEWTLGS